ncbi:ribonuclease Z [Oxalobacteraceae bacterium R-40]|uniref:Ribonuclease Z n=1 Tax=Keguizhuia sedimenti TaxID=3064264 RepID=A0ABU1BQW6_9BURK|nr:ribonuclease Z [Oxalobacteraceae bacterium R-40]
MEILFLGTSSGAPTKSRNMSALSIRSTGAKQWYLVDCGEGTQHRILHTNFSLFHLSGIFITHIHGDHCYGLPGLLASAGMLNRTARMHIVGPPSVRRFVEGVIDTTELRLPYPIDYIEIENSAAIDSFDDVQVQATPLSHRVPSFAYSFTEKAVEGKLDVAKLKSSGIPTGPAWSSIQQGRDLTLPDGRAVSAADYLLPRRKARKIIVGGDNDQPGLLTAEAQDADVLIHEATYTEEGLLKAGPAPQHSSAWRVALFAHEAKIRNLVLTHFSPRYHGHNEGKALLMELEKEAKSVYKGRLFMANDLDRYALDKKGILSRLD